MRFLLPALLLILGCQGSTSTPPPPSSASPSSASTGTVTVEFQIGESTRTIEVDDVVSGSTVESVMRSITDVPLTIHGSGQTAFVDSIDGISTSGSEGWTYKLNGEFANEGIGTTELTPPAKISWSYGGPPE